MKVTMIAHTPNPELIVSLSGKICYSKYTISECVKNGMDTNEIKKFIDKLISLGHESPLEHVSFTFGIEGISRACSHQLVRHRIASYSQKSQRYVSENDFDFVLPESILNNEEAKSSYDYCMNIIDQTYNELVKIGIEKEDARMVLPNACETQIIVTMNARSLLNFFKHRCCNRAQWEIREVADEMLRQCKKVAPNLFSNAGPSCLYSKCSEGNMSCGNPRKVDDFE